MPQCPENTFCTALHWHWHWCCAISDQGHGLVSVAFDLVTLLHAALGGTRADVGSGRSAVGVGCGDRLAGSWRFENATQVNDVVSVSLLERSLSWWLLNFG